MFLEIGEVNFAKRMPLLHPFFPPKIKLHTFSDNSQSTSVQCRNATERKTQCGRVSYNRSSVQAFEKSTIIKDYRKNNLPAFHFAFRQHFLLFGSNEIKVKAIVFWFIFIIWTHSRVLFRDHIVNSQCNEGVESKRDLQSFLKQDLKLSSLLMAAGTRRANPTLVICTTDMRQHKSIQIRAISYIVPAQEKHLMTESLLKLFLKNAI